VPYLRSSGEVQGHMREALSGSARWVFLAEGRQGKDLLQVFALLALAGGVPEGDLVFGEFDFFNVPTGHRALVAFLTVPKAAVPAEDVNLWLPLVVAHVHAGDGQDIILLPRDSRGQEALTAACIGLKGGTCYDHVPTTN
jgi:hypothetical protein